MISSKILIVHSLLPHSLKITFADYPLCNPACALLNESDGSPAVAVVGGSKNGCSKLSSVGESSDFLIYDLLNRTWKSGPRLPRSLNSLCHFYT